MEIIFENDPCDYCMFEEDEWCIYANDGFCFGLIKKYQLTNNGLNAFYNELYCENDGKDYHYKGRNKCENCKYCKEGNENYCTIDGKDYYTDTPFHCLYLDENGEINLFGKQIKMNSCL